MQGPYPTEPAVIAVMLALKFYINTANKNIENRSNKLSSLVQKNLTFNVPK
jgi:hypothetical protein